MTFASGFDENNINIIDKSIAYIQTSLNIIEKIFILFLFIY